MEFLLRLIIVLVKIVSSFLALLGLPRRSSKSAKHLPPIKDDLLNLSIKELQIKLRTRQLSAIEVVNAYITRIKAINPVINAVVEERFVAALEEAKRADEIIRAQSTDGELATLFNKKPLIGLPMTVKEACAVQGMSLEVGSLAHVGIRAKSDGVVVKRLRHAGAIPLLVSAMAEMCYSIESFSYTKGRCLNPFDLNRTPGGSSGGEGALNGSGASLFGLASDIGGSIRIPSLFCGTFGHKPTAGVVSVVGHYPDSNDEDFGQYLQLGPITRFACDLSILLRIMAGDNASKLKLNQPVDVKQLRVHYMSGFDGLNGLMHPTMNPDIPKIVLRAVEHCRNIGLPVSTAKFKGLHNSAEIALSGIARLKNMPYLINDAGEGNKVWATLKEFGKNLLGNSKYTYNSLNFELLRRANAFMSEEKLQKYKLEADKLKQEFIELLGSDGVFLFPTLHVPAIPHNSSPLGAVWGVDYTLIWNILGLPVTHVPMGLGGEGLPIGCSVIAAPYQDHLCFAMAQELEEAFGGWVPPPSK